MKKTKLVTGDSFRCPYFLKIMEPISIDKGHKLSKIWNVIPSNTIIFKNITGIGATTLEINSLRHSIIIEPNVPVIKGKAKKHNNVLGVYKGIGERNILDYLRNDSVKYKKIITTPESFEKIFLATLLESDFDMKFIYENFFLLFDECDKITKDVGYRSDITIPMNRFFDFKNKSFISATALFPSDPRFKENSFEYISIVPTYDIAVDINLYTSNNIYSVFEELMDKLDDRKNFIFLNSLKGIEKLISLLRIKESSAIFCSDKALENVEGKVKFSSSMISEENFQKYNFFTSRFFSAVDIDIDYDCNIFLITDTELASYTAIDPNSEAIQVIGRFRNDTISKNIYVMSDANKKFQEKELLNVDSDVSLQECVYDAILKRRNATQYHSSDYFSFSKILKSLPFNDYIDDSGKKAYFKIDNVRLENSILAKFKDIETLKNSYQNCKIINTDINYFNVKHSDFPKFFDAKSIVHKKIFLRYKDLLKLILKVYKEFQVIDEFDEGYPKIESYLKDASLYYPEIFEAIDLDLMDELSNCLDKTEVVKMVKLKKLETDKECIPFIEELRIRLPVDSVIKVDDFKVLLRRLIEKYKLSIAPTTTQAKDYLKISDRFRGRGEERNTYYYRIEGHL